MVLHSVLLACATGLTPRLQGEDQAAGLKLAALFSDHMVLQRETRAAVWGWASPGASVTLTASWDGRDVSTRADGTGRWQAELATPAAGGPFEISVRAADEIVLRDVWSGEVWLCSGQSNMEMPVDNLHEGYSGVLDYERELSDCAEPRLHLFEVANAIGLTPAPDMQGAWRACDRTALRTFSATAYFFGRRLAQELDVPVGLIAADWGGTVCESWTSFEALRGAGLFAPTLEVLQRWRADPSSVVRDRVEPWRAWFAALDQVDPGPEPADDRFTQSVDVPGAWTGALASFDGSVWMEREFELPASLAGRELALALGPIDDMDTCWLDGRRIAGTELPGHHAEPRRYGIPPSLTGAGRHTLRVRVVDTGGPGGVGGAADDSWIAAADAPQGERVALAGTWRACPGRPVADMPRWPTVPSFEVNSPTALFNGMIAPLIPFALRGAIWYQGESNRTRSDEYQVLFPTMVADWRARFGRPLSFYFVQIAPFGYGDNPGAGARMRDAQRRCLSIPGSGMAVTLDIGDRNDIHPKNKRDVGSRLALWALARDYGRTEIECSGPLPRAVRSEGGRLRIEFEHASGGLVAAASGMDAAFEVAAEAGEFRPARATLEGAVLWLSAAGVAEPTRARYAARDEDSAVLFNTAGLPASSFILP